MTAADLARIRAAIERDAETEAANWPLSRERARLYLALARAMVNECAAGQRCADDGDTDENTEAFSDAMDAERAALLALAPAYTEEDLGHA